MMADAQRAADSANVLLIMKCCPGDFHKLTARNRIELSSLCDCRCPLSSKSTPFQRVHHQVCNIETPLAPKPHASSFRRGKYSPRLILSHRSFRLPFASRYTEQRYKNFVLSSS